MPTDEATLKIVTNSEVLAIQESSTNGREVSNVAHCNATAAAYKCNEVVWAADDGAGGHAACSGLVLGPDNSHSTCGNPFKQQATFATYGSTKISSQSWQEARWSRISSAETALFRLSHSL